MNNDSRITTALQDTKCGAAALNDALTAIVEVLDEGLPLPERARQMLEQNRVALSRELMRCNSVIGSLTRIVEETPGGGNIA